MLFQHSGKESQTDSRSVRTAFGVGGRGRERWIERLFYIVHLIGCNVVEDYKVLALCKYSFG